MDPQLAALAIERTSLGVFWTDLDGGIVDANPAACRMLGYARAKLLGLHMSDIDQLFRADNWRRLVAELRHGGSRLVEGVHRRRDGAEYPVETDMSLVEADGEERVCGCFRGVALRGLPPMQGGEASGVRRPDAGLGRIQDELNQFRVLIDRSWDAIFILQAEDARVVYANRAAADSLGYPIGELLQLHVWNFSARLGDETAWRRHAPALIEQKVKVFETGHRRRDGHVFPVEVGVQFIPDEEGGRFVAIARDITERKRTERQLRLQSLVLDQIQDHVTITDLDGTVIYVNQAEVRELGRPKEEILGRHVSAYGDNPDSDASQAVIIRQTLERGHWQGELVNYRSDGTCFPIDLRTTLVKDDAGQPLAMVGIGTDIAERKKSEAALRENETRFRRLFESTDAISVQGYDKARRVIYWNPASERLYGYTAAEAVGRKLEELIVPRDRIEKTVAEIDDWLRGGRAMPSGELTLCRADGACVHVFSSRVMLRNADGEPEMYRIDVDVTDLRNAEQKVRLLSQAVEQSPVSVVITDTGGNIEYVNSAFERVTGFKAGEVKGRNARIQKSGDTQDGLYRALWQSITRGHEWQGELLNRKKSGEKYWERVHIAPVMDPAGNATHYLAVKEDISFRKQQEERILRQAHFDALTALPNRFLVLDRLSQMLNKAERNREQVAVLFLDLDDFKKINDSLGHDVGDRVLVEAARRLSATVRSGDTVGRLGGDEFIVLLGGIRNATDVLPVAEAVLAHFRTAIPIDGRELLLTTSVGIALFPEDGGNPSELLRNADNAMYHSKEMGRNTFSFFTETLNRGVSRRLALEEQLHGALERREFRLCYQPRISVASGRMEGAEALIRWNNPVLGEVSPEEFVPVAEQCGLIVPIGQFVLTEALAMAARCRRQHGSAFTMAVNLSPRQFRDSGLVDYVTDSLRESGLPAAALELEITEGLLLGGHASIGNALAAFTGMGIRLAMDDFGTGYSSLSYLRSYPFDVVKIDRSFVQGIASDPADRELVNASIAMGHGLGLTVVAEGVETREQLDLLAAGGCDSAQGYLFSRPLSGRKICPPGDG